MSKSNKRTCKITDQSGNHHGYMVECPACGYGHCFDKRWKFNGDFEKPSFTPSMMVNNSCHTEKRPKCHSYVTDGKIQFLSDCTHAMAGKTVELEVIDDE